MLEPAELKSILEAFFRSAFVKIEDSRRFIQAGDLKSFSLVMHAFKGLALSLHMIHLGELAAAAERVDSFSPAELPGIVEQMETELSEIKDSVEAFYTHADHEFVIKTH